MFTVANHCQIMGIRLNLSHELTSIYTINFIISLHLMLLIIVQTSDVMGLKLLVPVIKQPSLNLMLVA